MRLESEVKMTLYVAARALHIAGALGMFTALGVDLAGVTALARARTAGQVRHALDGYRVNAVLGPAALLLVLVPGIFMAAAWAWQPWIRVAFFALLLIVVLGATVSRRKLGALGQIVKDDEQRIDPELRRRLQDPVLRGAFLLRALLTIGIVVLMTTKPGLTGSLLVLSAAVALTALLSMAFWRRVS
jgi:hypothetical protein